MSACAHSHTFVHIALFFFQSAFYKCSYSALLMYRFKFVRGKDMKYSVSKSSLNFSQCVLMNIFLQMFQWQSSSFISFK